jgi:hypothetical protein
MTDGPGQDEDPDVTGGTAPAGQSPGDRSEASFPAWTPLRLRLFRGLWLASVASNVGTWMQDTAAAWLMTTLAPSPTWVAAVQVATTLPILALALPAGALADVVDRHRSL